MRDANDSNFSPQDERPPEGVTMDKIKPRKWQDSNMPERAVARESWDELFAILAAALLSQPAAAEKEKT